MTSMDTPQHRKGDHGSVESWLISAGRDRRPGSPLNVPPIPASNFVLGERRTYSRDDGTPGWEALEEIGGGLEGGSAVAFASGMAGISLGPAQPRDRLLMHYPHSRHRTEYFTVWRDGDWKVIYHYFPTEVSGGSHYQLFNLKKEPFEQKDLAATEPGELKRLMKGMVAALAKQYAVYPVAKDGQTRVKPRVP